MKKPLIAVLGLAVSSGFVQDANALWWKSTTVECKARMKIKLGIGDLEVSFEETWTGQKSVCRDGNEWCWGSSCS